MRLDGSRSPNGAASLTLVVIGLVLVAMSFYRASANVPPPTDCCPCGSLRQPHASLATSPQDTLDDVRAGRSLIHGVVRECEAAMARRSREVHVESAVGAAVAGWGAAMFVGRTRRRAGTMTAE